MEMGVVGILALGQALKFPARSWLRGLNPTRPNVSSAAFAFCRLWFCACAQHRELGGLFLPVGSRQSDLVGPCSSCTVAASVQIFSFLLTFANISFRNHQRE